MSARALLVLLLTIPCAVGAQVAPPGRARPDTVPRRDTLARRDSLALEDTLRGARDSVLVRWAPRDSVMEALLQVPGYTATRFQGEIVTFDARQRAFQIQAGDTVTAAVERGTQTVVTDTVIIYEEANKIATVRGSRIVISDPSTNQADIVSRGLVQYNLATGSASITNPRFPVEEGGASWYLSVLQARMVPVRTDSGKTGQVFYGRGGTITSCPDSVPDYYFETKEIKKTGTNTIVARPAILYIKDIPVMWLPFIFQDTRGGRRSGVLTPQFGVADIVRSSTNYRRQIQDVGYYFAINPYMDARVALDWMSNAGASPDELPGFVVLKGEWNYKWLDRFLDGHIATDYSRFRDHSTNLAITWNHRQEFSRRSRFSTSINYVTDTRLQRDAVINPWSQTSSIRSTGNYSYDMGPARLQLGGTRTQYPGRDQVEQTLPTLTLSSAPINIAPWLVWTPDVAYRLDQRLHADDPGPLSFRYFQTPAGTLDSVKVTRNSSTTTMSFNTPLRIFGYELRNSFSLNDRRLEYPQPYQIVDVVTGLPTGTQIIPNSYQTEIEWNPSFELPPFLRSLFNITPSVSLSNAMPGPFWVRSPLSNGRFIHQSKRLSFALSASPMVYGFFPGFGPFERLRHTLQPQIGFSYAPASRVDTSYLRARNQAAGRLLGIQQRSMTFGLTQSFEAKLRPRGDTAAESGEKIKLLSLIFSPLTYDFERARAAGEAIRGLTNDRFSFSFTSDLLPSFSFDVGYSLFQGSSFSDTAKFSPFREDVAVRLNLSQEQNPFVALTRIFGRAVPRREPNTEPVTGNPDEELTRQMSNEPVAGSRRGGRQFVVPPARGWSVDLSFAAHRPRPPVGANVIDFDPTARCEVFRDINPIGFQQCLARENLSPTSDTLTQAPLAGAPLFRIPATSSVQASTRFSITQNWAASWSTSYDVQRHEFAAHQVSLQRNLHDWRAVFAFTQAPNGSFAFSFNIALKAQPDIKFDYDRSSYRTGEQP